MEIREGSYSSADQLIEMTAQLRDETCKRMEVLQEEYMLRWTERKEEERREALEKEVDERHSKRRRFWRRVGYGVGGAAIVSTNLAVDLGIITVSLGAFPIPIATSLSQSVGSTLIGVALPTQ